MTHVVAIVHTELREHVRPEVLDTLKGGFAGVDPLTPGQLAESVLNAIRQAPNVAVSGILTRPPM
jgi:hypothetical protein